jgi:SAM-dependent methyltransferase
MPNATDPTDLTTPPDWFESDADWQEFGDFLFAPARWDKAAEQVRQVVALLGPPAGGAVLDLCCGPGRHSLELARLGFRVTGVDRTADYLARAARRAADDGLTVEWVRSDMRRFVRPAAFDAALCGWTSFGYFADPADDLAVLRNLHASLRPGGRLLVDVNGKETIARQFRTREWWREAGAIVLEERAVATGWSGINSRWIKFAADGRRSDWRFFVRMYSAVELIDLHRRAGYATVTTFGGLDGRPYDDKAERLITVATA